MKGELSRLALAAIALVLGAAAEELLPKAAFVGFPVLLTASLFMACRASAASAVAFAVAAGAVEDAICSLPAATSVSFFTAVAVAARWSRVPRAFVPVAFPCFQLWLWLWRPDMAGSVFVRLLVSVPFGLAAAAVVFPVLGRAGREVALDG